MEAMKSLQDFFKKIEQDEASKDVRNMFRRLFQFKIKEGDSFVLEAENGKFSFRKGEIPNPDLLKEVTLVETDTQTLQDIIQGKATPSDTLEKGTLWMSSMMAVKVQNYWLLRLLRIGQGLR